MRRTVIAAAALGFTVLSGGGPALAAPPEIQQKSCEADGGTFDRDHGVTSCTTTVVAPVTDQETRNEVFLGVLGTGMKYTGWYSRTYLAQTTTTESQKGNGPVTTTQTVTFLSSTVNQLRCEERYVLNYSPISSSWVSVALCEGYDLFPPA